MTTREQTKKMTFTTQWEKVSHGHFGARNIDQPHIESYSLFMPRARLDRALTQKALFELSFAVLQRLFMRSVTPLQMAVSVFGEALFANRTKRNPTTLRRNAFGESLEESPFGKTPQSSANASRQRAMGQN